MKLTKTQTAALATIAQNPGKVIAWTRNNKAYMTINGHAENKLFALGLIATVTDATGAQVWTLTAPVDEHAATRAEGLRLGLTEAQIERFIARQA
jgi:hypothetical protein